jgi:SpoVK/Ycf46/Vps4 family AAA+-type ATPase
MNGAMNALVDLELLVRSRYPIIAVETWEEDRLQSALRQIGSRLKLHVYDWSVGNPIRRLGMIGDGVASSETPLEALKRVATLGDGIFHFKDLHRFLGEPPIVRRLIDLAPALEQDRRAIVLSAPDIVLPAELQKRSAFFRFALPSAADLKALAKGVIDSLRRDQKVRVEITDADFDRLVDRLRGMTTFEAEHAVTSVVLRDLALTGEDVDLLVEVKKELLARDGVLEFIVPDGALDAVGGFETLKRWLGKRRRAFTPEAHAFGIVPPKGILLLGVPGCGKTLVAKCLAQDWNLPLLKMEPGRLFDKFIGESEKNFEKALAVAEGMAPCVLMIDEIEKGFASVSQSESDAGLSRRIFGRLLGWLQDRQAPVFVVATSNNIDELPPEMVRKGRFDEIFFIDLPDPEERQQIFRIHLNKRTRDPATFDLAALAAGSEGFSGAEIEQAIVAALYTAFSAGAELTTAHIAEELRRTRPLSVTRAEAITALRAWAAERALSAR